VEFPSGGGAESGGGFGGEIPVDRVGFPSAEFLEFVFAEACRHCCVGSTSAEGVAREVRGVLARCEDGFFDGGDEVCLVEWADQAGE
jgi:hypothetical protein